MFAIFPEEIKNKKKVVAWKVLTFILMSPKPKNEFSSLLI